ncbi:MAG: hypothetical protein ACTSRP_17600 [Candidatus Helarchaeota archaeon]
MELTRKIKRKMNKYGIFTKDNRTVPLAIIGGYTRSGTTFLGRALAV